MTISRALFKIINDLRMSTPITDEYGADSTLCTAIEPKYKNVITLVLQASFYYMKNPYFGVKSEFEEDKSSYKVKGSSDELQLIIPISRFKQHGVGLSTFFSELTTTARRYIGYLAGKWSCVEETASEDGCMRAEYTNPNIGGTIACYLFTEIAKLLKINNILFSNKQDQSITLTGDAKAIELFITLIQKEFSLPLKSPRQLGVFAKGTNPAITVSVHNVNEKNSSVVVFAGADASSVSATASRVSTPKDVFVMATNLDSRGRVLASSQNITAGGSIITIASQADAETAERLLNIFK